MRRRCEYPVTMAIALALLAGAEGCSRPFYRQQADADAYRLTDQKAAVLDAPAEQYRIEVDPRSRMFDPFDPDCEPMPPDDPLSNLYLQCVDCKKGSKCWRCLPKTPFVENPSWHEYLPRNEEGAVPLDIRGAVETALIHSPDYQAELEDLYLSALDVSFERFRFDTQFFGGSEIFFTADGSDRPGSDRPRGLSSSTFDVTPLRAGGSRLRARRLTATGGNLVVGMANSLMWQFAGPDNYSSNTILDFSIVQPLLRGAGRTRVLERLTIAERTLLANVRAMERYRRGFYLNVVTGEFAGQGPSRRGGFFGGSGLEGFSGVGGGGFGGVGNFGFGGGGFGGQGGGGGFTGGAGAQGAGGYLGLLQNAQQIRNQRANVLALRASVEQLQASYEAGRIDRFQVDLAQQALFNAQSQLLTSENVFESTVENFKINLGLPPELPVALTDNLLDRFNLLDPDLDTLRQEVSEILSNFRAQRDDIEGDRLQFDWPVLYALLRERVEEELGRVEGDLATMDSALPQRRELLENLADRPEIRTAQIDPLLFSADALQARATRRHNEHASLLQRFGRVWTQLDQISTDGPITDPDSLKVAVDGLSALSSALLELSLVQAGARLDAITFDPVELEPTDALRIASAYRRDWQNARASLVDTWRLIYFNANDLLSDLDIVFTGDIRNATDNPFDLRDTTGQLRVGLQWDAPLTRLEERNIYRQALIEYQQARRNYYRFRDRVYQGLRNRLRQIRLNEVNFELRRAAVLVAIAQVDLTQLRLSEPPQAGAEAQFGDTTARDLVQSLSDLLNVQNDFLSVWVNYDVQRLGLDFDLGIMELDPQGMRIDNSIPYDDYLARIACEAESKSGDDDTEEPAEEIPLRWPEGVAPPAEALPQPENEANESPVSVNGDIQLISFQSPAPVPLPPLPADQDNGGVYNEQAADHGLQSVLRSAPDAIGPEGP